MTRWTEQDLANHVARRSLAQGVKPAPVEAVKGCVYRFTVMGEAEPAGSKQAFVPLDKKTKQPFRRPNGGIVVSVVDANKHADRWKKYAAKVARAEYDGPLFDCPLKVEFIFYRERPASHFCKSGLNKEGRENPFPDTIPDLLKVARGIEDSLQGICYVNDARIVEEDLKKRWGSPPRVEITISELLIAEPVEQPELFEAAAPGRRNERTSTKSLRQPLSSCLRNSTP